MPDPTNQNTLPAPEKKYPPETAGRLMIGNVPTVSPDDTISKIEELLLKRVKEFETINYIYVVLKNGKLAGVISIKDILRQPKSAKVSQVMIKDLIVAHPYTDQEHVANLALQNNIKAVPVADKDNIFLGVVPSDTILKVVYQEASEDILGLAGMTNFKMARRGLDDTMKLSIFTLLKHRLPWLIIGLFGGLLTAKIIGLFEYTLEKNIILASFIPLIVYMGGATLAQTQAFLIRDMALNPALKFGKYFLKQLLVIFFIAIFASVIMFGFGLLIYKNLFIIQIIASALFAAIISSIFTGLAVPYFFNKLKMDPANASGPIATIIQDLLGVTLYFLIASLFI
ncbi:magnesium transporter [Patescibacteria group bacterium]|nr:magnesium transporter [Patescibacteria group bacterium]